MKPRLVVHTLDAPRVQPYATTTLVPNPGERYVSRRIIATLRNMAPGSNESFLVGNAHAVYNAAKSAGFQIVTKQENGKVRVWRIA